MRKAFIILAVCLALALVFILVWKPSPRPHATPEATNTNRTSTEGIARKAQRMGWHLANAASEGAVNFYGRIMDQNGNPAEGVEAHIIVSGYNNDVVLNPNPKEGDAVESESITVLSDKDGRFSITGKRGKWLRFLSFSSGNYILPSNDDPMIYAEKVSFGYGDNFETSITPYTDPDKPFTFPAWKKNGAEPLIRSDRRLRFPALDLKQSFNLFQPASPVISEGGDVTIELRNLVPVDDVPPFVHKLVITVANGGIVETSNFFPYEAPATGYQESVDYVVDPESSTYRDGDFKKRFFLKLRGGKIYGCMVLKYQSGIQIHALMNPHGSRRLEPDTAKMIIDPSEMQRLDATTRP